MIRGPDAPSSPDVKKAWALHTMAEHARAEVTERFELAGIPTLAVKGIVTAETLYRDVVQRPMTDVDLRIRNKDFDRALLVARESGWPVVRVLRTYRNIVLTKGGISVDIETQVGPPGLCAMTVDAMLDRAQVRHQKHSVVRTPELHDHVIVLCVNAYKDKIGGAFPWALEDLVRIVRHPDLKISRLEELARQSKVRTLVWLVADWLAEIRGDESWGRIRTALGDGRPARPLYAAVMRRMLRARPNTLSVRLLARAASDTVLSRVRALAMACAVEVELGVYARWPGAAAWSCRA